MEINNPAIPPAATGLPTPPSPPLEAKPNKIPKLLAGLLVAFFLLAGVVLGYMNKHLFLPAENQKPNLPETGQTAGKSIKIGGILPLTTDANSFGVPIQQAVILAQKEINKNGGINGKPIELIWKDGKCEKKDAQIAAEQLVNEDQVEILLGGACSDEFLSAAPIAQAKKVITFSTTATSPEISKLGRFVFRTCPSDTMAGKAAAGYAYNKLGAKTAGVIAEDTDYAKSLKDVFSQNFTDLGGKVLIAETYATGTTDFSDLAGKAINQPVDVLYILPQTQTPGVLLVKTLKDQGVTGKILTAEVLLIKDAITEQGEILEGVTGISPLFDEKRSKTQNFLKLYKDEYNLEPGYPADVAGAYDFIYLIKEAYESGATDTDQAANYLYGIKNWEGAVGILNFDPQGDPAMTYSIRLISGHAALQVDTYTP